jgi:hypothetical protein
MLKSHQTAAAERCFASPELVLAVATEPNGAEEFKSSGSEEWEVVGGESS